MSWVSTLVEKRENNPKNAKKQHLLKTTRILNIKMSAIEGPDFAFARGGSTRPVSYATDIGVDHWFSAFSRWIIGGPPGISNGPQRVP